jgi:hypothetical protein
MGALLLAAEPAAQLHSALANTVWALVTLATMMQLYGVQPLKPGLVRFNHCVTRSTPAVATPHNDAAFTGAPQVAKSADQLKRPGAGHHSVGRWPRWGYNDGAAIC